MIAPDYVTLQYFEPEEIAKARDQWRPLLNSGSATTRLFDADYYVMEQTVLVGRHTGVESLTILLLKKPVDASVTSG